MLQEGIFTSFAIPACVPLFRRYVLDAVYEAQLHLCILRLSCGFADPSSLPSCWIAGVFLPWSCRHEWRCLHSTAPVRTAPHSHVDPLPSLTRPSLPYGPLLRSPSVPLLSFYCPTFFPLSPSALPGFDSLFVFRSPGSSLSVPISPLLMSLLFLVLAFGTGSCEPGEGCGFERRKGSGNPGSTTSVTVSMGENNKRLSSP